MTTTTLTIHSCPPGRVRAVLNAIDSWQLDDAARPGADRFTLGQTFQGSGTYGKAQEIHARLRVTAPEAVWTVIDGAGAECMGVIYLHVPELGTWTARSDHDGKPYFSSKQVSRLRLAGDDAGAAVDALLGVAWHAGIAAVHTDEETVVVTPQAFEVTWERSLGRIHVDGAGDNGVDLELPRIGRQQRGSDVDAQPATEALRKAGFVCADLWLSAAGGRIQTTEVYRATAAFPAAAFPATTDCGQNNTAGDPQCATT